MNKLLKSLAHAAAAVARQAPDLLALGGAGAISYGAGLIYEPAGYIVGGVMALSIGVLAARRTA
jgi:hypothetical protein